MNNYGPIGNFFVFRAAMDEQIPPSRKPSPKEQRAQFKKYIKSINRKKKIGNELQ